MKANEFVNKFGMPLAEMILNESPSWAKSYFLGIEQYESSDFSESFDDNVSIPKLKRLVESWELVESKGGLECAKKEFRQRSIVRWVNPEVEALRSAIADIESCGEEVKDNA